MSSSPLRLSFLAFVEHARVEGNRSRDLQEGLELFELAEDLGYDVGYVRHRHLEPYLSAPLPFLAAAGQRTRRLGLGVSVTAIRFENPARLAEEAATVDLLTGGRLHLGLSSGYANNEGTFGQAYGAVDGALREVVDRRVARFVQAISGEAISVADEQVSFAAAGTPLAVQPFSPGLRDRIAYGAGSLASAERTGRQGLGLQLSTLNTESNGASFEQTQLECIRAYRAEHVRATGRPGHVSVSRQILPVTSEQDAADLEWLLERDRTRQAEQAAGTSPFQFGKVPSGSPEEIAEALSGDVALREADELVLALPFDHPARVVRRILAVVAEEVAPALGRKAVA
ncbi:LLM class flavin-dependent oxidoreductase [Arthrobacter ginkgonis]|uniref:LLM class flavin-dependent oxidoreductase n=1 Tax=Arthrobacter ginkgonis TaxID=1630594 RepID=A0ABP7BZM9_9MICC